MSELHVVACLAHIIQVSTPVYVQRGWHGPICAGKLMVTVGSPVTELVVGFVSQSACVAGVVVHKIVIPQFRVGARAGL